MFKMPSDLEQLREKTDKERQKIEDNKNKRQLVLDQVKKQAELALEKVQRNKQKYQDQLDEYDQLQQDNPTAQLNQGGIDIDNPEDKKLLTILKHFGGTEILKVVKETDALQTEFEELKIQIKSREAELKRMKKNAKEAKDAVENDIIPLEKLLTRLVEKEDELRQQVVDTNRGEVLRVFLQNQQSKLEQERDLKQIVQAKEEELATVRADLCKVENMDKMKDAQRERAQIYIEWKTNLKRKHELLRSFRETQYRMLMAIKARRDTQYVVAELEKKAELEEGRRKADEYKTQIEAAEQRIKLLELGMVKAGTAMRDFRREFEQMRVAIMLDKTIKSTQMASLSEHKKRLNRAEALFQKLIKDERTRIQNEEKETWEPRLRAAQERMVQQLADQKAQSETKMKQVAAALGKRYEEGFAPLLREATAKYNEEKQASMRLRKEIENKEQLLKNAEEELRRLEKEVLVPESEEPSTAHSEEMDRLNMELRSLWVELKSDPDEVATFLSELDALAPYSDPVLRLYEEEEKAISNRS